jgi:UDP-sulfoquinovose synthase
MRVLILGADGYIGWALAQYLVAFGHEVHGVDNQSRRALAESLLPIQEFTVRQQWFKSHGGSLTEAAAHLLGNTDWDTVVNLAQMPSAPYSMRGQWQSERAWKNTDEVNSILWQIKEDCPGAHIVQIGSMGEYGTPNCVIPEGEFEFTDARGNTDKLLFPRRPSSIYHAAKVASTYMIESCCRWWGLTATDIMQGVVFGADIGLDFSTRLDADEAFGTVIHRFCGQAVAGLPLTIYGAGTQQRSFLTLNESVECLRLVIENPPAPGEYRTLNQFSQVYSINELAAMVYGVAQGMGLSVDEEHVDNPRVEAAAHFYQPVCEKLPALGFAPMTVDVHKGHIACILQSLLEHKTRVKLLMPKGEERTTWR